MPTPAAADTAETEAAGPSEMTLVWLDPATLIDHPRNARDDLRDLEGLTASIAAVGVIEALSVIPQPDGTHLIDAGHRRKHAAVAAGRRLVPCLLRPDVAAEEGDNAGQATQIARKVGENMHREGLSPGEEARAYQSMLDLRVKPTEIARQTGQPRRRVLQGLGLAKAGPEFGESLQAANLTLDQAAAVAAYAGDPQVTATLIDAAAASDGAFRHALSRAKQDRTRARNVAAAAAALTEAGVR